MKKGIVFVASMVAFLMVGFGAARPSGAVLRIERAALDSPGAMIHPELVGFNLLYWIDHNELYRSGQLVREINEIRPGFLRYPAGTASQNYDWRSNSVINHRLYPFDPAHELLETDNFLSILEQTGADAFVVVDITSAHLRDRKRAVNRGQEGYTVAQPVSDEEEQAMVDNAVAWARHIKARGHSPVYELGNEHYLAFLDYMVFTPEMYAEKSQRFIAAIREVDPEARFAICGPDPFHRSHYHYENTPWWPVVLKELAEEVDYLVVHRYWNPGQIEANPGKPYGAFQRDMEKWGRSEGVDVSHLKIGFTEWGGRGHMDEKTFGIFCFRVLCGFAENGVDYAVQWPFRWLEDACEFGEVQLIGKQHGEKRFAFHVKAAWSRYLSGKRVVSPSERIPGARHCHSFAAVGEKGEMVVALANGGDSVETIRLDVDWPDGVRRLEAVEISAKGIRRGGSGSPTDVGTVELQPGTILLVLSK